MFAKVLLHQNTARDPYMRDCPKTGEVILLAPDPDSHHSQEVARQEDMTIVRSGEMEIHANVVSASRQRAENASQDRA